MFIIQNLRRFGPRKYIRAFPPQIKIKYLFKLLLNTFRLNQFNILITISWVERLEEVEEIADKFVSKRR